MIPHFTPGLHRRYPETRAILLGKPLSKTIRQIIAEVAEKHGFTFNAMLSNRRPRKLSRARHEAFYRCITETTHSTPTIGRCFGGMDHTSVIKGAARYKAEYGL